MRDYHRSIMREREEEERRERERQYWEKRLAEWDDEYEMERGEELYYVNRYTLDTAKNCQQDLFILY